MRAAEVWGITPDRWPVEATVQAVLEALEAGTDRIIIRERRQPWDVQVALVDRLLSHGIGSHRILLRLGPDDPPPPLGWSVHIADGVRRPTGDRPVVSGSAHHPERIPPEVDHILVAPFARPTSKPATAPPLGPAGLRAFLSAPVPVVALGGITPRTAASALQAGAQGVASIGTVFLKGASARQALLDTVRGDRTDRPTG